MVYPKSETASFFFPSKYHITGFPKTKNPVIAADVTNSKSIAIGMINMSSLGAKFWRENINETINIM